LPDTDRDRNESVVQRPHPDYDAIGVRLGTVIINPSMTLSTLATNNVFVNNANKMSDVALVYQPYVRASSDWSRHRIVAEAAGDIRRFETATTRNQNAWYVNGQGRVDISQRVVATVDLQASRVFESPYTNDLALNVTIFSRYLRKTGALKVVYTGGRVRGTVIHDRTSYAFNAFELPDGSFRTQQRRNRTVNRNILLGEFALTPSISVYGQTVYEVTSYPFRLDDGSANRDSSGIAALAGISVDLAGLMRGAIGVGYNKRDFRAATYKDVAGPSIQARVQFFPSPITNFSIAVQREFQDANFGGGGAFTSTRFIADIDHELLQNLILSASTTVTKRDYADQDSSTNVFQASAGTRYQLTRSLSLGATSNYGKTKPNGLILGNPFSELRGMLSVRFRR
jgi:hypothetical protein